MFFKKVADNKMYVHSYLKNTSSLVRKDENCLNFGLNFD